MPKESVVIKGTKEGLTIVVDDGEDFEGIRKGIAKKLQESKTFFNGGKVSLKLKSGALNMNQYKKLEELFTDYGMSLQEASSPKTLIFPKPHRKRVLLLKKTIRSGQKISYNGTIVILGDVNPGSELVAAGDILIMGTLRGMAHAGAKGDTTAIVAAYRLQPTQLRIADVISRPPEGKEYIPEVPEVARLKNRAIIIDPYNVLYKQ